MNKEEIATLKENVKSMEGQDILVKIDNAIQYYTTVKKAKIIVSDEKLIISDEHQQDFIIEMMYLEEIEISEGNIEMIMSNDIEISLQS